VFLKNQAGKIYGIFGERFKGLNKIYETLQVWPGSSNLKGHQ